MQNLGLQPQKESALKVGSPLPEAVIKRHFYGSHLLKRGFLSVQNDVVGTPHPAH